MMINFTKRLEETEMKLLDQALSELDLNEIEAYEEIIELWITYGGD
jgi:hypothetical protein